MTFIQSTLFSNTLASLALLCSIWSLIYTYKQNKYQITVSNFTAEKFKNIPLFFCFDIINSSTKGIRIKKVELIKNGKTLHDLQFNAPTRLTRMFPTPSKSPLYSKTFKTESFFAPQSSDRYKYHLNEIPDSIRIFADKPFYRFRKNKLFVINLDDIEQYNEV
ncbi:hypothetical protein [Staphylococcus pseudintermedius]|uniref:hypothetical protein n=1 Tax=Staphylococcus pseudintermedius TaxID=283734 RepID=UPI000BBC3FE5|nr:hypothetical protein [Staphylococcus pseudintermedius]MDU9262165.1 hypothetical protein [Staphylococcus pseudintermedius]PCE56538.1 hypothetical protein BSR35_07800 [Staphylococcus pseudintermedius]QDX53351.1 hypothetical protein DNH96_11015 [Staphylococcus pseudintermedius]HAR6276281.1 hypothetical protein [Staphylococcus pseudintermedius]